jgi:hypothetical protein
MNFYILKIIVFLLLLTLFCQGAIVQISQTSFYQTIASEGSNALLSNVVSVGYEFSGKNKSILVCTILSFQSPIEFDKLN